LGHIPRIEVLAELRSAATSTPREIEVFLVGPFSAWQKMTELLMEN
jgi:hypothetical protein